MSKLSNIIMLFLFMQVCKTENTKLYVGALLELTENFYSKYAESFVYILRYTFDQIERRGDILTGFNFELVVKDAKGIPGYAAQQLTRLAEEDPPKVAVIGPLLSYSLTITGQIVPFYNLLEVQCEFGIIDGWYRSGDLMPFHQAYDQEFIKCQKISVREASLKMNPNMVIRKKCSCKQNCSKNCYCVRNKLKCSSHCHPSRTCTNIETSVLNLDERKEVEDNECLTDKHMTAAQNMLKQQFPTNNGLYDTLLTNTVTDEPTPYIQIHHFNGNHWVTAAANTKDGAIELYDSLITGKATSDKLKKLRNFHGKNAQVKTMTIQQQCGNRDCGLFAVVNATSICHSEDPSTAIHYLQEEMRGHFLTCIEIGTLTMFPHEIKKECYKRRVKFVQ